MQKFIKDLTDWVGDTIEFLAQGAASPAATIRLESLKPEQIQEFEEASFELLRSITHDKLRGLHVDEDAARHAGRPEVQNAALGWMVLERASEVLQASLEPENGHPSFLAQSLAMGNVVQDRHEIGLVMETLKTVDAPVPTTIVMALADLDLALKEHYNDLLAAYPVAKKLLEAYNPNWVPASFWWLIDIQLLTEMDGYESDMKMRKLVMMERKKVAEMREP